MGGLLGLSDGANGLRVLGRSGRPRQTRILGQIAVTLGGGAETFGAGQIAGLLHMIIKLQIQEKGLQ